MNAFSRNAILQNIGRNPEARPPGHPEADQFFFRNGVNEYRWSCDDNGMLLSSAHRAELIKVTAFALRNGGKAHIITEDNIDLGVNMAVAGFGGRARWSSITKGNLRGGYIFLASSAQQEAANMPEPVSYLDPRKVVLDEPVQTVFQRRVHHHRAPDVHIHHEATPTHERPLTLFGWPVRR